MMTERADFRKVQLGDMPACAKIFNDWVDATPWMPRVHTRDNVISYYQNTVGPNQMVWVTEDASGIQGFLSSTENFVTAVYVSPEARGRGVGKTLLDEAKMASPSGLSLWTFAENMRAQKLYEREGFKEVRRTNGDNEEGLPDIFYSWPEAEAPA